MNHAQIQTELFATTDKPSREQSVRHLMMKLKKEDQPTVLEALLGVFFFDNHYEYQQAAAGLLWTLKPKYQRNLREDMRRSLKYWNASVAELPWYFAEVAGIEQVRGELAALLSENLTDLEKYKAETYTYWLSAKNPDELKTELDHRWNGRLRE